MTTRRCGVRMFIAMTILLVVAPLVFAAGIPHYVITNDNEVPSNTVTVYTAGGGANPRLTKTAVITTGGGGLSKTANDFFAASSVAVWRAANNQCAFVSDVGTSDVAGVNIQTLAATGTFKGSATDKASGVGMGLALSNSHVYAAFTGSNTIGTFTIGSGCTLTFVGDVPAVGLSAGVLTAMKVHGSIMVVSYGDGSIESFNISSGTPVSNNDAQFSTGSTSFFFPSGVDITADGHFAIFGDGTSGPTTVEVSDISSGKLTPTVVYGGASGTLGAGLNSSNIWLSPDGTLLYISNNFSGQVTAVFFDATTGTVSAGCVSSVLKNFLNGWNATSGLATATTSGTGTILYVAEAGDFPRFISSLGIVSVTSSNGVCTLTESSNSPAIDAKSFALLWISSYPPRAF